ncbi:MAG TPA: hypothetical protein VIS05_12650 [Ilumatobacter sp.]
MHEPLPGERPPDDPGPGGQPTVSPLAIAAIASAGAGVLHAAAVGIHAEHAGLSRVFVALAAAQVAVAIAGFLRPGRLAAGALVTISVGALTGWIVTRLTGIGWIGGLEVAERAQLADTAAAILATTAAVAAAAWWVIGSVSLPRSPVLQVAAFAGVLVVFGLVNATGHDHAEHADANDISTTDGVAVAATDHHDDHTDDHHDEHADEHAVEHADEHAGDGVAEHTDEHAGDGVAEQSGASAAAHGDHGDTEVAAWPRPWDPTAPIDFSGVPGVTAEQQARAEQLARDTLRDLPAFADVTSLAALGYRSIGDERTGVEHFINVAFIGDDKFLDPTAPESLVFAVDGDRRTLVSAMFIANETAIDDPKLTDFAGPLMQWHVHNNLCWGLDENGVPVVKGVLENFGGTCPAGTVNAGGENPMVHVWIAPHECGPFAALEGHGAGQAAVSGGARMDQCDHDAHDSGDDHGANTAAATTPYDPTMPIDLGGIPGVTPQQQAFAENLVAATIRDLPQWADLDKVAAAGFRSIGDGFTGHEHYIQWDWIDDDVWLDPDYPESLVFEPQPDGTKRLVSAMFMLPGGYPLDEIPDWGGALMQWHVHGDLCFTADPVAPRVAGVKPVGTSCASPLVDGTMAPMIHVWIIPHECGPFAALDGVGGGQVPDGEAVLCDTAHGSH